ncbi:hypothetical protein H5410_002465, partial [Solanum commersonii]
GYCLYRQNKLKEALESLKGQEGSIESMLLESQILYHLGKMGASNLKNLLGETFKCYPIIHKK